MIWSILFPVVLSHCSDSEGTWQQRGRVWVMCVSAKAVAALCFTPPCQVIWTSQSVFLFVMRCGAGSGDKSIFPCMFPSSSVTIKYQLHFRLIQVWELWALRTLTLLFCMIELMHFNLQWPLRDGSKQCKLMVKTTYRFMIQSWACIIWKVIYILGTM